MNQRERQDLKDEYPDQFTGADIATHARDMLIDMNRVLAAELRAPEPVQAANERRIKSDADRLYDLYRRIVDNNDGEHFGMSYEHDWLGCVEGYLEKMEEMAEDLVHTQRAVRRWIIEHATLPAIDLQSLATAAGIPLPVREVRDHRETPRTTDDSMDRAPDSRRLDRA